MERLIDLRSDTLTKPTEKMRRAMYEAEVGDDVYGEDPTINRLEELAAEKVGMEKALFVPSGTMGNQIAVMAHTERGDEIILESEAHIYYYEVGGITALAGVQPRLVPGKHGIVNKEDIEKVLRSKNIHYPETKLICLENTHNRGGGTITPLETMEKIKGLGIEKGISVHLDGARVFNASTALQVDVKDIIKHVDSVMFCLSKGLCAPVGSIIAGKADWIEKAKKYRKMLGGGMRQAGILAAAGILSITDMVDRLAEDHENAAKLAKGLSEVNKITIDLSTVQTNIVAFSIEKTDMQAPAFSNQLKKRGILANPIGPERIRMVTHNDVNADDIDSTLDTIKSMV